MTSFRNFVNLTLILVYLVIIAGAVVRMTGSGMGCPDWPKCFGYYIPPTDAAVLQWQQDRSFEKGQVIMHNKGLLVASKDFKTKTKLELENWVPYTKHDYATFNVWHTWIEYINRLLGALAGFATLILAYWSFKFRSKSKIIPLLSCCVVLGMAFQAWLGATVVYSVLAPAKITTHMVMALVIVAMLLYLIYIVKSKKATIPLNKTLVRVAVVALVLTAIQIILGTQVRQLVDYQIAVVGDEAKNLWLADPALQFYIHRSLSILVVGINVLLAYKFFILKIAYPKIYWIMGLLLLNALTGIAMYYLDFPFASQPLHLVLAALLFGVQFYIVLEVLKPSKSAKTL